VLSVGLGALITPVLVAGAVGASPDHGPPGSVAPIPPVQPVASEPLARGAAGEFAIKDRRAGVHLEATRPTDVVLVKATLPGDSSTGWHRHPGPSMVIVESGTLRMIAPGHGHHGCTEQTFTDGSAFPHPSSVHNFANDQDEPVVFYIAYFVPEGASPAPVMADPPRRC
jgi:quercetin dioxygenase-like cupin family protein